MQHYLQRGSKGEEVRLLQKGLSIIAKAQPLITRFDGQFGPGTELALKRYQSMNQLPVTGVYDAESQDMLGPEIDLMFVRLKDIADFAYDLRVEPAALKAVFEVESKGDGFLPTGECVILFEGHQFYKLYERKWGTSKVRSLAARYPKIVYPNWTAQHYLGGRREWDRLNQAKALDHEIAYQSCSWGLFQVMGFNYSIAGYNSLTEYVQAMQESEHEQFYAGCSFIQSNPLIHKALQVKDWAGFARRYNGPGFAKHNYHGRLAQAYRKHILLEQKGE